MPYTKEEYERLQKISTPPTLKEKLAFGLLPYLGKRAEMIQLSGEIQEKVNDAAKFTEKVTPVIEKNFKDLSKYDSQYANAVNGYNKFLESKGIKKPDGTYELSDKDYNDALSYEKSLNTLKDALDNKINDIKTDFQNNDIKYKDTSNGLEITDDRIKRIGKLQTYSQAYLKEMSDRGKLGQGLATLGTLGILETAGWVVALTPISAIVAKLPIVRNVLGVGKYIAKPIKVASALTISAGLTAASAYSRYKEYLPLGTQTAKLGAVSGAAEMVGGYALGATLINIVDNVNFQKGVKENIMNILKDKSGELSPEKRRRKAQQQLVKVEKDVSEKIAYTKEQADFEFKNADYDRQRKIIKDVLQQINSLPTQEEKLQGLLNLNEFLKRTIGKEEAKKLVQSISVPTFRIVDTSAITSPVKVTTPIVISKGGLMPVVKPISPAREWAKLYKPINPIEEYYNRLETRTIIRVGSAFKTRERTATATATALATKYRDEQIAIQKQAQASAQKYAQQVKQAQALAQKQEQKLMQQYRQAQPQLQVQRQAQKQEQQQKQVYQQAQKLIQQQKIMQNQILRQAQKLNASLKITTMKPIEIIPIIGIPIFAFEDKSEKKRKELEEQSEQAYQALIKRKGKYMPVGKPMQKARAERLGEFFARTTLARTFKVAPTQLRVKATRERY
jgi:hypothetical protein